MNKSYPFLIVLSLLSVAIFIFSGCTGDKTQTDFTVVPSIITTNVIANVTSTSAVSGGFLTFTGNATVTANGVCWSSTNAIPTVADKIKTDSVVETNYFSQISGLSPNTTYYVRAFATNSAGTGYGSVIKFTTTAVATMPTGTVTTFAGSTTSGNINGTGTTAQFNTPSAITVDATGNLYVADSYNNLIRKITQAGIVTTVAGSGTLGYANGTGTAAQFYSPEGIAVDASGNLFVSDFGNNLIRKITSAGVVTTLAGNGYAGYADGTGSLAVFKSPRGITVDGSGNLYLADRNNNLIRKITSAGVVTTVAGYVAGGYADTTGILGAFRSPGGVVLDATAANVYVADQNNGAIRQINLSTTMVTTYAGFPIQPKLLNSPNAIAMDGSGNLFFIDVTGRIMELTVAKVLYTLAGAANTYGFADGIGSAAKFSQPQGIAIYQGALYIADSGNNSIRKITIK